MSLRLRVTLAFAAVSVVVLVALGLFLHARLRSELDGTLRAALRQRLGDLSALAASGRPETLGRSRLIDRGDDVAQVLDRGGRVVVGAPGFETRALLTARQRARSMRGAVAVERPAPGDEGRLELLAAPAGSRVVVVGASLEDRDDALSSLDALLYLGIPIAIALAAAAGYLVAGSALAPMERLRLRAEAVGARDLAERLPVPGAEDEVRRLAETLNGMLDRLEVAFERERGFVADASHELRTPLARLAAELELASREGRDAKDLRAAVRSAADETARLIRLAEDLLDLARADQDRAALRPERIAVAELLEATRDRHAPDATVEAPDGLSVTGDRQRIERALGNLADNARRHGRGRIRLRASAAADGVTLHVEDEGPGVPPDLRANAFERFTRGDPARGADGGTGLGLAIVAATAALHGGRAGIADGPRSDVWIRLPA